MTFMDDDDKLDRLSELGYSLEAFTDEQLDVLRSLTDDELAVLTDIRLRLDEHEPETQAHTSMTIGGLFF